MGLRQAPELSFRAQKSVRTKIRSKNPGSRLPRAHLLLACPVGVYFGGFVALGLEEARHALLCLGEGERAAAVGVQPPEERDAGGLPIIRHSLLRDVGAHFQIAWPGNRDSQPLNRPFLRRIICSSEKQGYMNLRGLRPPEPARSRNIWLKNAVVEVSCQDGDLYACPGGLRRLPGGDAPR